MRLGKSWMRTATVLLLTICWNSFGPDGLVVMITTSSSWKYVQARLTGGDRPQLKPGSIAGRL